MADQKKKARVWGQHLAVGVILMTKHDPEKRKITRQKLSKLIFAGSDMDTQMSVVGANFCGVLAIDPNTKMTGAEFDALVEQKIKARPLFNVEDIKM